MIDYSLKYQAYLVNGFNGYDGNAHLSGKNGLRKGRQKGAESFISSPNITGKVEYYAFRGLNVGLSGYFGKTQSTLYDGINKKDQAALRRADSSVVGISMLGADARYSIKGIQLRMQYYYASVKNSRQYNYFTASEGVPNDLGSSMTGYYLELGYNIFKRYHTIHSELVPFIRYETFNTHHSIENNFVNNKAYNNKIITIGFGWRMAKGAVLKSDVQFYKSKAVSNYSKIFNAGIGVMF
jgi:hypothetical protein